MWACGNVTYPYGGKGAYTVYKTTITYYTPPYKRCIEDNGICGKRILGDKCLLTEAMTVDSCIDYCREGNYKWLKARNSMFLRERCGTTIKVQDFVVSVVLATILSCAEVLGLSSYEVPIIHLLQLQFLLQLFIEFLCL